MPAWVIAARRNVVDVEVVHVEWPLGDVGRKVVQWDGTLIGYWPYALSKPCPKQVTVGQSYPASKSWAKRCQSLPHIRVLVRLDDRE